jgi:hypothetical protein
MPAVLPVSTNHYRVEDAYVGNLIGALRSIDAGVTSVTDLSQVSNTPEQCDALIKGLVDSGIRAICAYSRGSEPGAKWPSDVERLQRQCRRSCVTTRGPENCGSRDEVS